jgi:hypothetical protein
MPATACLISGLKQRLSRTDRDQLAERIYLLSDGFRYTSGKQQQIAADTRLRIATTANKPVFEYATNGGFVMPSINQQLLPL